MAGDNGLTSCAICGDEFQDGEIVIAFRQHPGEQQQGHIDCLISLVAEDDEEDD
jgi:hypothetical protein